MPELKVAIAASMTDDLSSIAFFVRAPPGSPCISDLGIEAPREAAFSSEKAGRVVTFHLAMWEAFSCTHKALMVKLWTASCSRWLPAAASAFIKLASSNVAGGLAIS